jgi:hypothetical protein
MCDVQHVHEAAVPKVEMQEAVLRALDEQQ